MNEKLKGSLSVLLAICIIVSMITVDVYAVNQHFDDAKGHWAEEAIRILADKDVIAGYPDGLVHPDDIITRGEFAALVSRIMEPEDTNENEAGILFADLNSHWSKQHVDKLILAGVIQNGDYGRRFLPDEAITRIEMIRMLVRTIGKGENDESHTYSTGFKDCDELSNNDEAYICTSKIYDIVQGYPDGTLRPHGKATRAEAFEMLVKAYKAKERIEKEEPPVITNLGDELSGKKNGGSSPAPQFSFTLPEAAYTADEIEIKSESRYVSNVTWSASINGLPAELTDTIDGDLSAKGGKIKFIQPGDITLIAAAKNSRGVVTHEQIISIYSVITAEFSLPKTAHTDTTVAVELSTENLGVNLVEWSLQKEGNEADIDSDIIGELNSTGGTVLFKEKGKYMLEAAITDELDKTITAQSNIEIYPVAEVKITLPAVSHTDKTITLQTETKETDGLSLTYTLTRNGESVEIDEFIEGELSDGSIRFKEKGVYALTASVIDETGRVFADTADIIVYPVGSAGFYLPEIFHTDKTVMVEAMFGEIGNHTAEWSLLHDNKEVSLDDAAEGMLNNSGGELRFRYKGNYVLKAEFTDDGGRSYNYEQGFKVYPVPAVSYSLPKHAHTDTDISVVTETYDLDALHIEWLVDNTFGFQDWPTYVDGRLANDGGIIHFKRAGIYELVARIKDETGRVFLYESEDKCEVLPVLNIDFELPIYAYTDTAIDLRTHGNNNVLPVEWHVSKDGVSISLSEAFVGSLTAQGGKIIFLSDGEYVLTAVMTDYLKRSYSNSESIRILPVVQYAFTMPQTVHYGSEFDVTARDVHHLGNYTVLWMLKKDDNIAVYQGTLGNDGGKIAIRDTGEFVLTSSIIDSEGRVTTHSENIAVTNTAPNAPVITAVPTRTVKDGKFLVNITASADDPDGDAVTLEYEGTTEDSYYVPGTYSIRARTKDIAGACSSWTEKAFTVTNAAPTVVLTAEPTRTVKDGKFLVNISAVASDAEGDETTLEWENKTADNYYSTGTHTVRVRAKDNAGAYSAWAEKTFTITSSAPVVTLSANPTRTVKNGKFLVNISAAASDADGDSTILEWENKAEDNYYNVGTHTVRVRAKDATGLYSEWISKTFVIANSAPTSPVITRTPSGNSVPPGTPVTIKATSSDPDGDPFTLVWEGRNAETQTYPLGRNMVRVKAVDSAGAESPWAAIVFFVADSNGSGGMTLTGPDSVIMENGLEGATITEYTFTVPPVSGHSGSDHGRVRGFNRLTGQWDQLDYGTTSNGITFSRALSAGVYTKLEFYYYTNHDCMYNKSNITYSVSYHFE